MKKVGFMSLVLGSVMCWLGCSPARQMPEGELVSIEYSTNTCRAENQYEGSVQRDSAGRFVVHSMKKNYGPLYEKIIGASQMKRFREIIEEEKMYRYKESYQPRLHVLDGWGWHFCARFSDGSKILSGGSNARPDGNGLARIRSYMEELVSDGVLVEAADSIDND